MGDGDLRAMHTARTMDGVEVVIPSERVDAFFDLWTQHKVAYPQPTDFVETLRRAVANAFHLDECWWWNGERWVFRIEDNILEEVRLLPKLTQHARARMRERSGTRKGERFRDLALAIALGRALNDAERQRRGFGVEDDAIECGGCVFIVSPRTHSVVTVLQNASW